MDRPISKITVTQDEVKRLKTSDFLTTGVRSNPKLISQLIDSDSAQEAFTIVQAAGFTGNIDVFKADIQKIQQAAKGKTLTDDVLTQLAYCGGSCGGDDLWAITFI